MFLIFARIWTETYKINKFQTFLPVSRYPEPIKTENSPYDNKMDDKGY
jgi:hypothetical protein